MSRDVCKGMTNAVAITAGGIEQSIDQAGVPTKMAAVVEDVRNNGSDSSRWDGRPDGTVVVGFMLLAVAFTFGVIAGFVAARFF